MRPAADPLLKLVGDPGPVCRCCEADDHSVCASLTPEGLRGLRVIRGNARVAAHDVVFDEGQPAEWVYSLTSGTVKLSKLLGDGRRQIVGFVFPGDFFGFAAGGEGYPYTAEAVTPVGLCRFATPRLAQLRAEAPDLERLLFDRLVADLALAQEQMLLLGRMAAREKVAHFLLTLSRRAQRRGDPPSPVALPMSRQDLADFLGLTIETVSRTFTQLKRDGLIALPRPELVDLLDSAALRRVAEGGGSD
ncbi:Crp/Fnr family transcriptional regulator [Novispirillum sp. DQ9]|uniref:Crp/Fnr family transcriptional regulator n=1 Tax=Novispirillum sp. DQ9 TaxID=3398612 RepID=UPI003C7E25F6